MKKNFIFLLALVLTNTAFKQHHNPSPGSVRRANFDNNWRFHLGDVPQAKNQSFNDSQWRLLNLPHDWSIEGKFSKNNLAGINGGALPGGIGWYRKTFSVQESDSNKLVFIDFGGVFRNSQIWINGHYLGNRPYGYSTFRYELTPYLHMGGSSKNVIVVRADNSEQPNSRWYSGSGIYRNVWLVTTNKVHVGHWGTQVTTPKVSKKQAVVLIKTTVDNDLGKSKKITVLTKILDSSGHEVGESRSKHNIKREDNFTFSQEIRLDNPQLWSPGHPVLYKAVSFVKRNNQVVDQFTTTFGVRYFRFDSKEGFFLNGKHMKIRGVCLHENYGCLGDATYKSAIRRQLQILKGFGCNAIRTSHNPPSLCFLQLCDKMGFLVVDEAFDCWEKGKKKYDYHIFWDKWHRRDLSDMIKRDRNHPSIIVWSIGNEIPDQRDSAGGRIAHELAGIVHSLDTTRPITSAMNIPESKNNSIARSGSIDLIGHNYGVRLWKDFFNYFPGGKFIATETTSALETRGHYDMPSTRIRIWPGRGRPMNVDQTCSAYDNCRVPWGSTHEKILKAFRQYPFVSGIFVWTGFDYIGEPTPYKWPSHSSYFGIVDLAGFPKDAYYLYKSLWTDSTVLHIFPSWNSVRQTPQGWHKGDTVDVWAYYNHADSVELFLNGKSLGKRSRGQNNLHVMWQVIYEPGTLKAVSLKNGRVVKTAYVKTTGVPAKIVLSADVDKIKANGKDLSFVTVKVEDKNGLVVPHADNLIRFKIAGPGSVAGVGNGDETDLEPYVANYRKAFNGLALAVIKPMEKPGTITLTATSDNLSPATIKIYVEGSSN